MPSEILLIIWFIIARFALWGIEKLCRYNMDRLWKTSLCMFFSVMTGVPFFLLFKDGWFAKLGLEETTGAYVVLVLIVGYWIFSISRLLTRLQSLEKRNGGIKS
ncbi:MAG TPA: hypothetical protein ENJ35_01195 [Gammaproteobacteria bacterium]|nr:hypothetical protein [Gammaproteobacteria bacterium]